MHSQIRTTITMKKSLSIILLGILFQTLGYAQKEYTFIHKLHPNKTYILEMDNTNNNETTVNGVLTKTESLSKVRRTTITKEANTEGLFPTSMAFDDVRLITDGKEGFSPISNTIIEGLMAEDSKFKIDTIINPKLDRVTRDALKVVFKDLKPEIEFPKTPMKMGDTFSNDTPMTIPLYGEKIKLIMTKTYTLKGVLKEVAEFSVATNVVLNMTNQEITVLGDGNGQVLFDINENQVIKDNLRYTVNIRIKTETGLVLGYAYSNSKKSTEIN